MNIVHLEGLILGLNKAKETYINTNQYYKYDIIILDKNKNLSVITGNLTPYRFHKAIYPDIFHKTLLYILALEQFRHIWLKYPHISCRKFPKACL